MGPPHVVVRGCYGARSRIVRQCDCLAEAVSPRGVVGGVNNSVRVVVARNAGAECAVSHGQVEGEAGAGRRGGQRETEREVQISADVCGVIRAEIDELIVEESLRVGSRGKSSVEDQRGTRV